VVENVRSASQDVDGEGKIARYSLSVEKQKSPGTDLSLLASLLAIRDQGWVAGGFHTPQHKARRKTIPANFDHGAKAQTPPAVMPKRLWAQIQEVVG